MKALSESESHSNLPQPRPSNPDSMSDEAYGRAIARVEALTANQSGSDKSWVFEVMRANRLHFEGARRA